MTQPISVEAALAAFREQYGKVVDENVLLRAQATMLEARVTQLEEENARLQSEAAAPSYAGVDSTE